MNWRRCKHVLVRCIHGDEIIERGGRRRLCQQCGKALKGPLPRMCYFTGRDHKQYRDERTLPCAAPNFGTDPAWKPEVH